MLFRGLFNQKKLINFFKYSNIFSYLSISGVFISIILFFSLGLNYGIDFRGGTMFMISTPSQLQISDIRFSISKASLGDVSRSRGEDEVPVNFAQSCFCKSQGGWNARQLFKSCFPKHRRGESYRHLFGIYLLERLRGQGACQCQLLRSRCPMP